MCCFSSTALAIYFYKPITLQFLVQLLLLQNSWTSFSVFPCYSSSVSDFLPTNWRLALRSPWVKALSCPTSSVAPNRPVRCLATLANCTSVSSPDSLSFLTLITWVLQETKRKLSCWCSRWSSDAGSQAPFMKRVQNYKNSKTNSPARWNPAIFVKLTKKLLEHQVLVRLIELTVTVGLTSCHLECS